MRKLLCRLLLLMLLGVMSCLLIMACSPSRSNLSSNFLQSTTDCHVVKHPMGETCVPNHPQRVVTIMHTILGTTLMLGVKPIASSAVTAEIPCAEYVQDRTGGIEVIGTQNAPSMERILTLKPDLILVWQNIKSVYPLLSKISPTVVVPWRGPALWQEQIETVSKALGKEQAAQEAWKRFYQRVDALKQMLGDRYRGKKFSVLSPSSQWGFFIQARNSFPGFIFEALGLERPESQAVDTTSGYVMFNSQEKLELIDGDIVFVLTNKKDDQTFFKEITQSPLGKTLRGIQQNQVYYVDGLTWSGANLLAADAVIDDLYRYLVSIPERGSRD